MSQFRAFFARLRRLFSPRPAAQEPAREEALPLLPDADREELRTPEPEVSAPELVPAALATAVLPPDEVVPDEAATQEIAPHEDAHDESEPVVPSPDERSTVAVEPSPEEVPTEAATVVAAAADALVLRLNSDRDAGRTFEVVRSGATVGRGPENSIRLEDLSVSRRHARIAYRQGGYWISDIGSVGGTWVDGRKLDAPRQMEAGQTIDIGVYRLAVEAAPGTEQSAAKVSRATRSSADAKRGR